MKNFLKPTTKLQNNTLKNKYVEKIDMIIHIWDGMAENGKTGAEIVAELGGKDLNRDGRVVNLVICGNSKFYDYSWLENQLDLWVEKHTYPDMIILGGASGVDFLAERWADNNNIPSPDFVKLFDPAMIPP